MAAILFSFDERQTDMNNAGTHLKEHTELLQTDMRDAKKHLKEHSELYWIVGFGIRRDQFTYPIDGYMHVKGRNVQYKVKIKDIKSFSREHYADKDAELFMPQKWIDWWLRNELKEEEKKYKPKNTIIITEIYDFPYATRQFKKINGSLVKRPPQNYIRVLPPDSIGK